MANTATASKTTTTTPAKAGDTKASAKTQQEAPITAPSAANNTEATDMAKKGRPEMAGKKVWSFDIKHDQEVPAARTGGRRLPFNFDQMRVGSMFHVPKEFWVEFSGLSEKQANDVARNKEAIRRSFYGWRDQDAKRKGLALAFSDQHDPKDSNRYLGVNVYMTKAQGA